VCGAAPDPILGLVGFILRIDASDDDDHILTYSHQDVVVTSIFISDDGDTIVEILFTVSEFSYENPDARNIGGPSNCV
jgi:hypothetical protein